MVVVMMMMMMKMMVVMKRALLLADPLFPPPPPLGESSRFSSRQLLCHKHKHTAQTEDIKYQI